MPVPVHELATTEQYLAVLDGHAAKFPPGERFAYCNGGYVVLALIAERTSGVPFHELVVGASASRPACATRAFLRSDELPGRRGARVSRGRRRRGPTCSTCRCAAAETAGSTRPRPTSARSGARSSPVGSCRRSGWPRWCGRAATCPEESRRYGLGFWLHASSDAVMLEGYDAGVSFRSVHDPRRATTHTVISNTSDGAWPIARLLDEHLAT